MNQEATPLVLVQQAMMAGGVESPTPASRLWLSLMLLVVGAVGLQMRRRHHAVDVLPNQGDGARAHKKIPMGGAISGPKAFWLGFAVYLWFVVCPAMGVDPAMPSPLRETFLVVGVSMWIRGVLELLLLYVVKAWRPPMGIAHDVLTLAMALATLAVVGGTIPEGRFALASAAFLVVVLLSLVVEIVHAVSFYRVVQERTVGDDGIWFADEDDPRFAANNRRTLWGNALLGAPTAAFLLMWFLA